MLPLRSCARSGYQMFVLFLFSLVMGAAPAFASEGVHDLTAHPVGIICLVIFLIALTMVILEEQLHLAKSKPVVLAAGIIWLLIGITYRGTPGDPVEHAVRHNLLEYAELFLFLLVAMTYISAMSERQVFNALRSYLVNKGFSLRSLFWITGVLAFFISPVADNLTTALLMGAVAMAVGGANTKFVSMACINIVVGANAGGAFSPFGDITTLMVWQKGLVDFGEFFRLFVPSVVTFLVPALIMSPFIPKEQPSVPKENAELKEGAVRTILLFLFTIATAVSFHNFLHIPPVFGMMLGLGYLKVLSYYLKLLDSDKKSVLVTFFSTISPVKRRSPRKRQALDVFEQVAQSEWDTLLFFYGIVMAVGGLGFLGYLHLVSAVMYTDLGPTTANILVGFLSSVVDNIPVMFAVLSMLPQMDHGQWLLVTLTAGVGGSMLSVGSAAGVALMGQARGKYTFFAHLKWTPAIIIGYFLGIACHMWLNAAVFDGIIVKLQ